MSRFLSEADAWHHVAEMAHKYDYAGLCTSITVARNQGDITRATERTMLRKIRAEGRRVKGPGYRMDEDYIWHPHATGPRTARYQWAVAQAKEVS